MRCFVAIRFPEEINRELGRQVRYLAGTDAAVRWVREENLHVTLKFLGDVQDDEVRDVHRALSRVAAPPLSLSVCGLGCFPPK
ncbi:MAG: RNA 2',3'-cyclic phosphodiesterase, partial [Planctomycetota bacterium]